MRTSIKNGGMPHNFNKVVLNCIGHAYTSAYVTMVRKGIRHNESIERAIKMVQERKIFA